MKRLILINAGLFLCLSSGVMAEDKVDYDKQIRPLFAETCYKCHAGAKHKGDLKLDSVEAIKKGGKEAKEKVIIAGNADKSDLFRRIVLPKDDDDAMPPDGKGDHLTKPQQDLIKIWITQGADFGSWTADKAGTATPDDKHTEADSEGPKEIALPQVALADVAMADKIRQAGALVLPLAQGTNLLAIEFTSNASQITDQQVALLAPVAEQVYDLNLANTKVTDSGLAALEGMKNLHRLHLEKTGVTDAGLAHLKGLKGLEYLNLYNTPVTDAGLVDLTNIKSLKNVYLWQSKVTDAGAESLKKSLVTCAVDTGWKEPVVVVPAPTPTPAPAVNPPVPAPATPTGKLVIRKAVYGNLPAGASVDVTVKVAAAVKENKLSISSTNEQFTDPAPGTGKILKVDYTFNGVEKSKTGAEGETFSISDKGE